MVFLLLLQMSTENLILKYFKERLSEGQALIESGNVHYAGTLYVRTYFNHDSLLVEVQTFEFGAY